MTRATSASSPALAMTGVQFDYRAKRSGAAVLRGATLHVMPGEWVAVMGSSGSGKSTLLLCAAGLLRAKDGAVLLDGVDVTTASERVLTGMRRDRIGFVFQDDNLVAALTVEQNIGLPARFGGRRRSRTEVAAILDRLGLADKVTAHPEDLSGGQRQRVAIARALIARPAVVFADEPTGALDACSAALVLDAMYDLVRDGAAVVMVTHDPSAAARADRVAWLHDGRIIDELSGATAVQISSRSAQIRDITS